ncbi:hypothetical protein SAMD00019534_040720 [Acytostelium subglobosum LB1]|uniref:hypothetical protein n=1 Tax=Acytostelium subglobosum LB1 TaxID=1410327 RepID=UPI000644B4ED|nr:hypothetical protein SAMD00019534_040720 [Acytostelium subglobosum LB1]GAM20897.1 hypothetical protein SAMD00019534_040720 [Acytostelium subglobosum LB1]|eukprot:XP_012756031.1 hypothetical protein SAMD00019534_040720 [Acytostelium subglobosum LB1]
MKEMAMTYTSQDKIKTEVTEHFKQLHDQLIIEEHRINRQLIDEMDKATTTINDIIKELNNIDAIFNCSSIGQYIQSEDSSLVDWIINSNSLEEFISNNVPEGPALLPSDQEVALDDYELLGMYIDALRHIESASYNLPEAYHLEVSSSLLESTRQTLYSCFKLTHHYKVFSASLNDTALFDPHTGEWTTIGKGLDIETENERSESMVYARGNVYMFGIRDSSTYSRFSMSERRWHHDIPIVGVQGGRCISVCYDGHKYIYLLGGQLDSALQPLDRVDQFNIETQQFSPLSKMVEGTRDSVSFLHKGQIYSCTVGARGLIPALIYTSLLQSGGPSTNLCTYNKNLKDIMICFYGGDDGAGIGKLYIHDDHNQMYLLSFNENDNKITQLTQLIGGECPIVPYKWPIVVPGFNAAIHLGGKDQNYKYSFSNNKWSQMKHIDNVGTRRGHLHCLLSPSN